MLHWGTLFSARKRSKGLSDEEAKHRLKTFGTNELHVRQQRPAYIKFLLQFKNFFAVSVAIGKGEISSLIFSDEVRRVFVRRENRFVLKWLTW